MVDVVRYWRSLDLVLHPIYSLLLVIIGVLIIVALGWWAILVLGPYVFLIGYVFRFDEPFRRHS